MNPLKTCITSLLIILLTAAASFAVTAQEPITMRLPKSVIQEVILKSLPLEFKVQSSTLVGSVSIDSIKDLQFGQDKLSGRITLSGHKLNIITTIAGHNIRLKIGSLTMDFQCDATMRFDPQKQTLFLKPIISEIHSTDQQKTDAVSALVLLFNNREFPLRIEKLKPMVADAGSKQLSLSMAISDIKTQPDSLLLSLVPRITSTLK